MAKSGEREVITVDDYDVVLTRTSPMRPARRLTLARCFVRVALEVDRNRQMVGALTLQSAGRCYEIGRFLGPVERSELAEALKTALAHRRI
jgi:uncharacterized membrane protein